MRLLPSSKSVRRPAGDQERRGRDREVGGEGGAPFGHAAVQTHVAQGIERRSKDQATSGLSDRR